MSKIREAKVITYKHWRLVSIYSAAHFLVDFACAFLIFRAIVGAPYSPLYLLSYNFCAFALQMPLGILADKWDRNHLLAVIGCAFVGAAFGLWNVPVAAVIVAGIGNAMFHIGGGIDVLNISESKCASLGLFVSPGAWGIYFGTIFGKEDGLPAVPVVLALFAAAGLILATYRAQRGTYPKNAAFSLSSGASRQMILAAACLFLVVCLRSYAGLTFNFPWKNTGYWGIALVCAVVLGKTAGGFAADRFGVVKTTFFSLGIAALLFLFPHMPLSGVTAVLLFNMTMPVKLWLLAKIFPGAKGFSFGLLTFGLFLGFLPVYFGVYVPPGASWPFALAAVVSIALIVAGLRKAKLWHSR